MLANVAKAIKPAVAWALRNGPVAATDCVGLVAVVLIAHGFAMFNEAYGYIVGGALLLAGVLRIGMSRKRPVTSSPSESA